MPYIGNTAADRFVASKAATQFSGDGSTTAFTLEHSVGSDEDILVSVDGVIQEPSVAYAVSNGTTLTFTAAPSSNSGNNIFVYYLFRTVGTVTHPSNNALSATTGTFSGAITSSSTITGGGLLTTGGNIVIPDAGNIGSASDTDAISIASNGVVTFSQTPVGAGGSNSPYFYGKKASNQTTTRNTTTRITGFTTDELDTDSAFDGTTFTVPSGEAGRYHFGMNIVVYFGGGTGSDGERSLVYLYKNGGSIGYSQYYLGSSYNIDTIVNHFSVILDLNASDYIEVYAYTRDGNADGHALVTSDSNFYGYKLA